MNEKSFDQIMKRKFREDRVTSVIPKSTGYLWNDKCSWHIGSGQPREDKHWWVKWLRALRPMSAQSVYWWPRVYISLIGRLQRPRSPLRLTRPSSEAPPGTYEFWIPVTEYTATSHNGTANTFNSMFVYFVFNTASYWKSTFSPNVGRLKRKVIKRDMGSLVWNGRGHNRYICHVGKWSLHFSGNLHFRDVCWYFTWLEMGCRNMMSCSVLSTGEGVVSLLPLRLQFTQ